jgi:lipopolysaccharide/colanic/teichoic acid biosynthesis glycosyltransferase
MSNDVVFPSKLVPLYGFALAFIFLAGFRTLARAIRAWLFSYNIGITNLLLVGNTKITVELIKLLSDTKTSGYRIVGVVADKAQAKERFPHLSIFESFIEAIGDLRSQNIHGIVQTELYAASDKNNQILEYSQSNHIAYRFVPGNSELFVGNIAVELFRSSIPVIAVHQTALIGWGRVVKRLTDLLIGGLFFVISLPFMVVIGLLIKVTDPRAPIFFKDSRLTRFAGTVKIYKFRSMKRGLTNMTPEEAFAKMGQPELAKIYRERGDQLHNDPRISRIGRFLRKTSLDELPQLFNIVKGDISLVGPRALQVDEWNLYDKKDLILAIKSGLTGLAQVSGRKDLPPLERRKLDLYYVQNWSLWMDITIIIKSFRVVFSRISSGKVD